MKSIIEKFNESVIWDIFDKMRSMGINPNNQKIVWVNEKGWIIVFEQEKADRFNKRETDPNWIVYPYKIRS